jgi:hypothetical protein
VVSAADPPAVVNLFSRPEPLLFFQVAPHLSSQGLSGPRFRPTATQKIWQRQESNPGPLVLQPRSLTTRPQRLKQSKNQMTSQGVEPATL